MNRMKLCNHWEYNFEKNEFGVLLVMLSEIGPIARKRRPQSHSESRLHRGVGVGVGTRHQSHRARSCELALRAVGAARGGPGGAPLACVWGVRVGRSPTPDHSSFRACGRGPLPTGCGSGGCGRGNPLPTSQRALLRAGFARRGGGMRVPGGGASCLGVGRPGSGAPPAPTTRPFRRAAGAHYPLTVGAGAAGAGTRHQPHSARSCELALRAVGAA